MRSGMTWCSAPCNSLTPVMVIVGLPAPVIFAPMALRNLARSTTSGSQAALSMIITARAFYFFGLNMDGIAFEAHLRSEPGKNLAHEAHVAQLRHAPDRARLRGEQRCRHDRQHRVLRPADRDFTVQRHAAFN